MADVITAILTADEEEGTHRDVEGAEQLVYPIHVTPVMTSDPFAEGMNPGQIVDTLLKLDLEDLIDVLHAFVPEMAVDAWIANIRRLKAEGSHDD